MAALAAGLSRLGGASLDQNRCPMVGLCRRGLKRATLRKIVDESRKSGRRGKELARIARDAAGKFMWALAGNLPDFEEVSRALYAKDQQRFKFVIRDWPEDIRKHLERLVEEFVRLENEATVNGQAHVP